MFRSRRGKNITKDQKQTRSHSLTIDELQKELSQELNESPDLHVRLLRKEEQKIAVIFVKTLTDPLILDERILLPLQKAKGPLEPEGISSILPIGEVSSANRLKEISAALLYGNTYIYIEGQPFGNLAGTGKTAERSIEKAETESLVYGPKISFTESLESNVNIIRRNLNGANLCIEDLEVGGRSKLKAKLFYIKDIADTDNVLTFRQRVSDLDTDYIPDTTVLAQYIEDNSWSVFPQILTTELPDRFCISLIKGQVGVLLDRSPSALYGPTTFFSFFETTEDLYMRWNMGTFLRLLRFLSIFLSVLLTPAYVAVLTYHYEVIPSPLLVSLGQSRSNVPFPPVFEALLLEFIIELLREAGARLPTKVGQTMGIVGGIVIGQAAVDAGFTSNILIIIIALSALGSFTVPSYSMGTAIRIIRFPIIIMAGLWGGIGIMISFCFLLIHLLKLSAIGRPYLAPIYPLRWKDIRYSMVRFPLQYLSKRPEMNMTEDHSRYPARKASKTKDVDE
ncbi:spore germination protein [Bacillus infantis]|uniref:spore germination protein n=1 Tax=Bacillus infantis TaxID=324767 RepID=UPI003CF6BD84